VSAEKAAQLASRLVVPPEPVPDRRHIRDVATALLAAVMPQLGLAPRLAGRVPRLYKNTSQRSPSIARLSLGGV
jgi:hypothetical protein